MKTFRKERITSLLREELSNIIIRELEFDGALVTLTDVDVARDLEKATVWVGIIPSEKANPVLELLEKSKSHLQYLLLKKMNIRRVPRLSFKLDTSAESAARVEKGLMD